MADRRKLAAGNWKMNGSIAQLSEVEAIVAEHGDAKCEILICPPATLIAPMKERSKGKILVGGQDCHGEASGAHTGDIAAAMLREAGAAYVIAGHSERRTDHGETNEDVAAKTRAALEAGLSVIVCIGETLEQREADETLAVLDAQLEGSIPDGIDGTTLVVAYEPVWAIGTGKVPSVEQIGEVHDHIRARLGERFGDAIGNGVRLLYGGSVKPDNAAEIFAVPNVDGALVGGASLKASDFSDIIFALAG